MKLVTEESQRVTIELRHFNPHEREARDDSEHVSLYKIHDFNPHAREARDVTSIQRFHRHGYFNPPEREARDPVMIFATSRTYHFNPHEREARDGGHSCVLHGNSILIHTSVKLVTQPLLVFPPKSAILIHTSVKLVTMAARRIALRPMNFNPHEREARDIAASNQKGGVGKF